MIRARLSNGDYVFGIDAENVRRLKDDQPIIVDLAELGGAGRVMIVYKATLQQVMDDLERATGKPLPVQPRTIPTSEH